ncbi:MAG TPA: acyl-ACP desaturase [Verrucomicrobiae bacterium]|nr:acyl-ACP desaturase [Verrucomicrobiae bacterium]
MATPASHLRFGTPHQLEVLGAMESFVRGQTRAHLERRKLWMPNELSPADAGGEDDAQLARVRELARGLPASVLVALALNLLTEEGLPHFHRLIATHMGADNAWNEWNNIWTAEEDRHGCAIRDYVRDARLYSMTALENLQYQYIEAGFDPEWEQDPYRLLAYTSLQEKATQIAHSNTGRQAGNYEPRLQRILAHVSGDESRHYAFYRGAFAEILASDPNQALQSLQKVTLGFTMPGHNVTGFTDMSEVIRRADIFGPRQYQKIVEELLDFWKLGDLTGLSAAGEEARDKLMKVPARLSRIADYADAKTTKKTFKFDFLPADRQTLQI